MTVKLPESARARKPSIGGGVVSALLHMSVIGGAVLGGHTAATAATARPEQVTMVYREPPRPAPQAATPAEPPPRPIATNVAPPPVPRFTDLRVIPDVLPPSGAIIGTVAADSFQRLPVSSPASGEAAGGGGDPYTESMVERAVVPLPGNQPPRYPRVLADAGVEGTVLARFVVDTAGRVERGSVVMVRSDHRQFEMAVRDALARMRFVPAEAGGRPVRQLVEQAFSFAVTRR